MKLRIAQATDTDASLIASILTEATQYKLAHGDTAWGSEAFTEQEIRQQMLTSPTYLVYIDEKPVGTFALQWEDVRTWGERPPDAGYMHRLGLKKGLHGQHIGEQVINWAAAEVAKNNRQYLRVDCDTHNTELQGYYTAHGFKHVGTKPPLPHKDYVAALYQRNVT